MRFREGIRDGRVTLTFRAWKRRQAKPGSTHRLFGDTLIDVLSVETVVVEAISEAAAAQAGFDGRENLLAYLRTGPGGPIEGDSELFRVAFRFAGDIEDTPAVVEDGDVEAALAKLADMDRRSARGPWTEESLELVESMPATLAAKLAAKARREVPKFKADVRKLKYMGLTRSLGTGYELTELGKQVLARRR